MEMERRRLALMFTDIVGYSRLMGQDEAQTIELLGEYRRILLAQIEHYRGVLIEFIGDAVFARFDSPDDAVQAGVAIQKDLAEFNLHKDAAIPKLQSRIGIHMGDVTLKGEALFGDDVNIAARLEPIAVADGVCISEDVYRAVKDSIGQPILSLGLQPLKNINHKVRCYLVRPAGLTLGTRAHYWLRKFYQKVDAYRYPLVVCFLSVVLAGFYFVPRWLVPGYTANYVEIADFKNLMIANSEPDYFSAGITEALRSQLADMEDVYILQADSGVRGPIRLEGSVQKVGDRLRIAYKLIRRRDNVQIAGGQLDASYRDIFILQDRVVAETAGYLSREFNLKKYRTASRDLSGSVDAYDYYLRGLDYTKKPATHENLDAAIKYFSTSLVHDEDFALSNAGLCDVYRVKFVLSKDTVWAERAEAFCGTAAKQDQSSATIFTSLGSLYTELGRYGDAIDALKKAMQLDDADLEVLLALANVYRVQIKNYA